VTFGKFMYRCALAYPGAYPGAGVAGAKQRSGSPRRTRADDVLLRRCSATIARSGRLGRVSERRPKMVSHCVDGALSQSRRARHRVRLRRWRRASAARKSLESLERRAPRRGLRFPVVERHVDEGDLDGAVVSHRAGRGRRPVVPASRAGIDDTARSPRLWAPQARRARGFAPGDRTGGRGSAQDNWAMPAGWFNGIDGAETSGCPPNRLSPSPMPVSVRPGGAHD
jgi:hypothetical protein